MPMTQDIEEKLGPLSLEDKEAIKEMAETASEQRVEFVLDQMLTGLTFEQASELADQHNYH